jgi:hypothetical protein
MLKGCLVCYEGYLLHGSQTEYLGLEEAVGDFPPAGTNVEVHKY